MTLLRRTLCLLGASVGLLGLACATEDSGTDVANNTETITDTVMEAAPEKPGGFDISRDPQGSWYFNLLGPRGDIYLASQPYAQKTSALNGILSVEENGVSLDRYDVQPAGEDCALVLRAGNGQIIADGGVYRSCDEAHAAKLEARELVAGVVQWKAAVTDGARFDLWRDQADKEWYFVMRAEDGRIILESEGYQARTGAVNGIESVRINGKLAERYKLVSNNAGVFVSLRAGNHQEIAESGPYASETEAQAVVEESLVLLISERVANPW